jgi:hypothetical protein
LIKDKKKMSDETAAHNLLRLIGKQPKHLTLLGILLPLVTMAIVGYVIYRIWKHLKDDDDAPC